MTTVVLDRSPEVYSPAAHYAAIYEDPDPNNQLACFLDRESPYSKALSATMETAQLAIKFATDSEASDSVIVRAMALDYGLAYLRNASGWSLEPKSDWTPDVQELYKGAVALIPEFFDKRVVSAALGRESDRADYQRAYNYPFLRLATEEGIRCELLVIDWKNFGGIDADEVDGTIPIAAAMLADKIIGEAGPHSRYAEPAIFKQLLGMSLNFLGPAYQEAVKARRTEDLATDWQKKSHMEWAVGSRIVRLSKYGTEKHDEVIRRFFEGHGLYMGALYAQELDRIVDNIQHLKNFFPEEMAASVEAGAQKLFADMIFAAEHHQKNGARTEAEIFLKNGQALTIDEYDSSAMGHISALNGTLRFMGESISSSDMCTVLAAQGEGFKIYRLLDKSGRLPPAAYVYLRPYGDSVFNPQYEYGRPGEGVEATINFTIDIDMIGDYIYPARPNACSIKPPLVDIRRPARNRLLDGKLSIRLDREGVAPADRNKAGVKRDPAADQGTVSLDVGSVLGGSLWRGTKIGRWLAWGNALSSQVSEKQSSLNHVAETFPEMLGEADTFARAVIAMDKRMQAMQASPPELREFRRNVAF